MGVKNKQHQPAKQETRCPPPKLMMFLGRKRGIKFFHKSPVFPGCAPSFSIQGRPTASQNWKTSDKHTTKGPCTQDSGQISIIPKPEFFGDFGEVPLIFTTIFSGWLLGGKRRYHQRGSFFQAATASRRNSGHNFLKRRGPLSTGDFERFFSCFFGECRFL